MQNSGTTTGRGTKGLVLIGSHWWWRRTEASWITESEAGYLTLLCGSCLQSRVCRVYRKAVQPSSTSSAKAAVAAFTIPW